METVHNSAMDRLNLVCENGTLLGLIGSFYFIGWMTATLTVPFAGDYYGRKVPFVVGLILRTCGQISFMVAPNIIFLYIGHFLVGYSVPLCAISSFYYIVEMVPRSTAQWVPGINQVGDGLTSVIGVIIIWGTKDKQILYYIVLAILALSAVFIYFTLESPVYLLKKRRFRELNAVLRRIGKLNRSDETEDFFPENDPNLDGPPIFSMINAEEPTPPLAQLCSNS